MSTVLVTDYVHPLLLSGLARLGLRPIYAPEIERTQVMSWGQGCNGIVINTKTRADSELIDGLEGLKWIARLGSGLDIIDVRHAAKKGISVISVPEANANAVAEHAMGMLLALVRNIVSADSEVRQGIWRREENRGTELEGKTIGIIGFGNNGSAFARKFSGWGVRILAYDKYKTGFARDLPFVVETDLEILLKGSDIISLHIPLTVETLQMVDSDFLSKCKPGAILINTSRGKVVDTFGLVSALQSGTLAGACLDVFENEKPNTYSPEEQLIYDELYQMRQVVLTPHIAGWTFESKMKISEHIVEKVSALLKSP